MDIVLHPNEVKKDFFVKCNCCNQILTNWVGSTPCCGSIAYSCNEDGSNVSDAVHLYGAIVEK